MTRDSTQKSLSAVSTIAMYGEFKNQISEINSFSLEWKFLLMVKLFFVAKVIICVGKCTENNLAE